MKIGVLADCFNLGVEGGIRRAAALGAQGVQLYAVSGTMAPENMTREKRAALRRFAADLGVEICAVCGDLGCGGFAFPEQNPGKIEYTRRIVDLALDLGCRVITTHIGVVPADPEHPRFQVMAAALSALGEYARGVGARFAIETGPEPARDLRRMLDCVKSPGLGVNLDPANLVMSTGDDPARAAALLGDAIVHTHAKDGVRFRPCDMDVMYGMVEAPEDFDESEYCMETPLGEGQVNFPAYLAALRAAGYDGYLTIEREVGQDPDGDIRLAMDFLRRLV